MNARLARKIELNVDRGASATLAASVAYATLALTSDMSIQIGMASASVTACAAYQLSHWLLRLLATRDSDFVMPAFVVRDLGLPDELILTDADRIYEELLLTESDRLVSELVLTEANRLTPTATEEPLLLDDIVEAMGPDSRVVRMFDRRAMPTLSELQSRIGARNAASPRVAESMDASQELADALAELRKALR